MSETYGTIRREGTDWVITAEPHVVSLARRIFPRVGEQFGTIHLRQTDEAARDLEWFLLRYPLEFEEPADRDHLYRRADAYERKRQAWRKVLAGEYRPRAQPLAYPLRSYQSLAVEAALMQRSLLLADEVGLGKTVQGIGILVNPECRPASVVAPLHLLRQWEAEITRFAPGLTTHLIRKGSPYDVTIPSGRGVGTGDFHVNERFPDVLLLNYEKLKGWAEELARVCKLVIFDECQELRHFDDNNPSAKAAAARHLAHSVDFRVGLSATPIHGYGAEFYNVLETLAPGSLGARGEFANAWCKGYLDPKARIEDPRAFGTYLRDQGVMLRRTRREVGREIPPVQHVLQEIDADTRAIDQWKGDAADLARIILRTGGKGVDKMQAAGELNSRMRQLTGVAKAKYVAAFVRMLVDSGEKVLLYGWHHQVYDIWREELKDLKPAFYTGNEQPIVKEFARNRFIGRVLADGADETDVLIMSLRAGAGVDGLQKVCRTVVFGELDWSNAVHHQAVGRVARDGQDDPVTAYYLASNTGCDPIMIDVLGIKAAQLTGVLEPEADLVEGLQAAEGSHARRLAEAYLRQIGEDIPEEEDPQWNSTLRRTQAAS